MARGQLAGRRGNLSRRGPAARLDRDLLAVPLRFDRSELARVQAENEALRRSKTALDTTLGDLSRKIEAFEQRTRRLAIVAGLQTPVNAGVGGRETTGGNRDLDAMSGRLGDLVGSLDWVEERLVDRQRQVSSTPSITPVRGILTSAFGAAWDPITGQYANHLAVDIGASPGRPVMASADGIVTQAGHVSGGLGTAVYLSHGFEIGDAIRTHVGRQRAHRAAGSPRRRDWIRRQHRPRYRLSPAL